MRASSMLLNLDPARALRYRSKSQKARVMSEGWMLENGRCANCGNVLEAFANNHPAADIFCPVCSEEYEIKCGRNPVTTKIIDGAYAIMMAKITGGIAPNLLYIHYNPDSLFIQNMLLIPRHFMTPEIITQRKPLSSKARRHGWVGCFIDANRIPPSGKIGIVKQGVAMEWRDVISAYNKNKFLYQEKHELRGWLLDIMRCIEKLNKKRFKLDELYQSESSLASLHPENSNIRPKIRQQLQKLRDHGYLRFLGDGEYELL